MIIKAQRLVERESTALAKVFEINGKRLEVLCGVHQQFAATLDTTEDKRNHLDIVNKVSAVQKLLTQIRNRCLLVNNVTSGEGMLIRTKDLSQILQEFSRQIVKQGEIEMRTRAEYLGKQINHLQDLLYTKDQQLFNLEHKLRHAQDELSKVTNTRVFAKANAMIYELDHSSRQLRLIKDSVYTMEDELREKVRLAFEKDLTQARQELAESRKKFAEYKQTLNAHLSADIKQNINQLHSDLKKIVKPKNPNADMQLFEEYSHLFQGQAKVEFSYA